MDWRSYCGSTVNRKKSTFANWSVPRAILAVYTVLLLYDGALRKWVFPEQEILVFIVKDVVLAIGLLLVLVMRPSARNISIHPAVLPLVVLYFLWIALEVFNPWLPNYFVAAWGLKSYALVAIALYVLIPLTFRSCDEMLRELVRLYPYVVLPICLVGIAQVFSPGDSWLNRQVRDDVEAVSYFGESSLVRVSGTFSYLSGMAAFVQTVCLLGFGLFLAGARGNFFLASLGVSLAALPISGSRSVVVLAVAGCAIMLFLAPFARLITVKSAVRIAFAGGLLIVVSAFALSDVWLALQERADSADDRANRFVTAFTNAFDYFEAAGMAGFGTGAANLGAPALTRGVVPFSWLPGNILFEEESGRIVIELGILGWAISILMRLALVFWSLSLAIKGTTSPIRVFGVIAVPILAIGFYQGVGVFGVPVWSAYVWFCVVATAIAHHENMSMRGKIEAEREAKLYGAIR